MNTLDQIALKISQLPEHWLLKYLLWLMGLMIVIFNVKGYDVLFSDSSSFLSSPFGLLIGCAEFAVLVWTSSVISNWSESNRVLKGALVVVVISFWFLCYTGINSYLDSLATYDLKKVEEARKLAENNNEYLTTLDANVVRFENELQALRQKQSEINSQISIKNATIQELNDQASTRRLTARNCNNVPDCKASVEAFQNQIDILTRDIVDLKQISFSNQERQNKLQEHLDNAQILIAQKKLDTVENVNQHAGVESSYVMKKASYEKAIVSLFAMFGVEIKDPFSLFMMIASGIIYPVYFLLNLLVSLDSPANKKARMEKRNKKLLIEKRKSEQKVEAKLISIMFYKKILKYLRVWAHRRTKTRKIEVEKEVEKIVEKEVSLKVDRIVEVPTEVPVFVKVIETVSEPLIIKDPQVIIHERIIPVPENITAKELEELLDEKTKVSIESSSNDEWRQKDAKY